MRRRQVYAARAAAQAAPAAPPVAPKVQDPKYKAGICPYCLKDMKRGSYAHIRMHEKHGHQRLS